MNMHQFKKSLEDFYKFKTFNGEEFTKYITNDSNCEFLLKVHCLSDDETIRLSVKEDSQSLDEVLLFETKDIYAFTKLYELIS